MPSSYVASFSRMLPIVTQPLPIKLKPIPILAYWHQSKERPRTRMVSPSGDRDDWHDTPEFRDR